MLRRGTPATNHPARTAARATVLAFALSAALVPRPGTSSSSATAPPPSRGVSPPPDVVLIVTDDQRASTLAHMPNLRKRLIDRGMRFRSAWVPNPACCPSRASYLTGTYSHTNGVWRNHGETGGFAAFDPASTLATWLDDAGYRTGLFGKYLNGYRDASIVPPGWDEWFAFISGDSRSYYGFDASDGGSLQVFEDDEYSTVETYRRVVDFIGSTPEDRPLFAMWTPIAPHRPFVPEVRHADAAIEEPPWRPPNYNERNVRDKPDWLRRFDRLRRAQREAIDAERIGQYRTLLSVDDGIRRIVKALRRAGRLSNTIVVFASDNGLMWGEHRLWRKAVVYAGATNVPMVIRYDPWTTRADRPSAAGLVSNIDVAPTVMDAVGIAPGSRVDGDSLRPILRGQESRVRARLLMEHAGGRRTPSYCGARTKRALFVRYATGEEEYYDLKADPWELDNLAERRGAGVRPEINELRSWTRARCRPLPPGFSWVPPEP